MNDKYIAVKKISILGICCNIFLLIIKIIIGFACMSYGMIADAFNSAGDIFASLLSFIGNKIASAPSDEDHNYGHGKAEYFFSLFIGLSMVIASIKIFIESIKSIIATEHLTFSWWLILICLITIITKFILFILTKKEAKEYDNILLLASSQDHFNDIFVTSATLIGILASLFNIYFLDGLIGAGISLWICFTGLKLMFMCYEVLMDKSINKNIEKQIINIINNFEGIEHLDKIQSSPIGNTYAIAIKISVNGNMTVNESHQIASKLKYELLKINHISEVIIHINPA